MGINHVRLSMRSFLRDGPRMPTTSTTTTGAATTTAAPAKANPWYPDHAVYTATKDQLKAMTEFKYSTD